MLVRKRLRITGRVQGVAFRASAVTTAQALGLAGWVANRADGSVETVAEGDEAGIAVFIRWCHQGPPAARVDHVEVTDEPVHSALPELLELFRNKRQGKLSFKKAMEGAKRWVYSSETTVR